MSRRCSRLTVAIAWTLLSCARSAFAQSDPTPVTGSERLAWEQESPGTRESAEGYRFVLDVDGGERRQLTGVTCTPTALGVFECSAPLPALSIGDHVLRMSAVLAGLESELSEMITVTLGPATATSSQPLSRTAPAAATTRTAPTCEVASQSPCVGLQPIVSMRQPISAVAPAGGGRVYFVEGGHYIRVVAGAGLLADPALAVDRATDRLIALAVDASFATTRLVWAAWLDESVPRARTLSVARFRDVNNRLGQRAIVLADLPVPASGDPKVAWDEGGQIFIAMPASLPDERPDPYGGRILRFAPDGSVPAASGQRSPVLMQGFARPTAIAADPTTHQVWVAGEIEGVSRMASFSSIATGSAQVLTVRDAAVVSVAPGAGPNGPMYYIDTGGRLFRFSRTAPAAIPEPIPIGNGEDTALAVSSKPEDIYVVVRSNNDVTQTYGLLRLTQ